VKHLSSFRQFALIEFSFAAFASTKLPSTDRCWPAPADLHTLPQDLLKQLLQTTSTSETARADSWRASSDVGSSDRSPAR